MMMTLDDALIRLRDLPAPDLSALDGIALANRARVERSQNRLMLTSAAMVALLVGVAGSAVPGGRAETSVVPFGPPTALTPLVQIARG